jgi:hypothetical protein
VTKYLVELPTHTTPHPPSRETFKALPDNPGSIFLVCNLQKNEKNERQPPQKWKMEDNLNLLKNLKKKTTSIF